MLFRQSVFAFYCFFWPTLLFSALSGFELALFANNGCYSHDVMLREVGETFEAMLRSGSIRNGRGDTATAALSAGATVTSPKTRHRIHWFQMFMYDFGFGGQLRRPSHWNSVVMETSKTDADSRPFMERGSRLLWEVTVPFDHNRPWNLRGALFLFELIWRNQQNCEHFVKSAEFRVFLSRNYVDLVVVDHFLQECLTVAASLLNSSATIQFSNWPIADGYIASLNVPAPPSAYPKTSTPFSAREMHSFFVRLRNSLFHALIAFVRRLQRRMVARFFASVGLFHRRGVRLEQTEAAHLFYAGRAEFIAEPVRPISNRIKHFGCANCLNEAQINQCQESGSGEKIVPIMYWPIPSLNISSRERCERKGTSKTQKGNCSKIVGTNSAGQMVEFSQQLMVSSCIRQQFPLIDWSETERRRFVLVSFGSIAKVEFMPEALFRSVLRAFSNFPSLLFVWQTNSEPNAIMEGKRCQKLPKNVRIVRWAPIKILLAHPNLHYAILHGGVNTVNEALIYGGKPILGLPLQGDQPSNLQRLVDLGMATQVDIGQVWRGQLHVKMALMEKNYAEYSRRAKQITAMIRTYRMGIGAGQQNFWLRWVANKPFLKRSAHTFFRLTYRSSIEHFALAELGTALTFLFLICLICS